MYDILHDLTIKASPSKIFAALSQPQHLNKWWTKESQGIAKIGQEYRLHFSPEYDWYAEVSICELDKHFELRMTKADIDWNPTCFGFELTEIPDGIQVSHYHKGWKTQNHHFRRSNYSWAQLLRLLKNYVEKGEIVPFMHRA